MAITDVNSATLLGWCQVLAVPGEKPHGSLRYVVVINGSLTHVLAEDPVGILVWTLILARTLRYVTCVTVFHRHN